MQWPGQENAQLQNRRRADNVNSTNVITPDASDEISVLDRGHKAYDMVWVHEKHGDKVRSTLCVRQFTMQSLQEHQKHSS